MGIPGGFFDQALIIMRLILEPGLLLKAAQTPAVVLPAANFTGVSTCNISHLPY